MLKMSQTPFNDAAVMHCSSVFSVFYILSLNLLVTVSFYTFGCELNL